MCVCRCALQRCFFGGLLAVVMLLIHAWLLMHVENPHFTLRPVLCCSHGWTEYVRDICFWSPCGTHLVMAVSYLEEGRRMRFSCGSASAGGGHPLSRTRCAVVIGQGARVGRIHPCQKKASGQLKR